MFKKVMAKAAAGTLAAGVLLVPAAATQAIQPVAYGCEYQAGKVTRTSLSLGKVVAPYGSSNSATVRVTSSAGKPSGKVRLTVGGSTQVKNLSGGAARFALPRGLDAQSTYAVTATFISGSCKWTTSSATKYYTVTKANVSVRPSIVNAKQARFSASFAGQGGLAPSGTATFTVVNAKTGKTVTSGSASVVRGQASVNLTDLKGGQYKLLVSFSATDDYYGSTATKTFVVRGR